MTDTLARPQTLVHAGTYVDLTFPAFGNAVPIDHGYALYGALAKVIPWLHGDEAKTERAGVFSIRGTPGGDRTLLVGPGSAVRLRVPAARLPMLLPLAGRTLMLDGCRLTLGVPAVHALRPAATLASPLVLIKLADARRPTGGGPGAGGPAGPTPPDAPRTHRPPADSTRTHPAPADDTRTDPTPVDGPTAGLDGPVPPDAFLAAARRQLDALTIRGDVALPAHDAGPRAGQPRRRVIRVKTQTHVGYAVLVHGLTADESVRLQEHGLGGRRMMGCGLFLPVEDETGTGGGR